MQYDWSYNQKNHRGQKVSCDDAFSEAAQKVITMQSVIKAAKGGDRNRSYLRLPTKSKGAIDTTIANTNDNNRKKEDDKSRNKKNISEVKSKVDTSSHRKNAQVEQQQSTQKGVAVTEGSKKTKRKSQKLKAKSESTTAQSKPASTAIASQKVVKKVKSKVTGKEDSTKATIKKKQVAA